LNTELKINEKKGGPELLRRIINIYGGGTLLRGEEKNGQTGEKKGFSGSEK